MTPFERKAHITRGRGPGVCWPADPMRRSHLRRAASIPWTRPFPSSCLGGSPSLTRRVRAVGKTTLTRPPSYSLRGRTGVRHNYTHQLKRTPDFGTPGVGRTPVSCGYDATPRTSYLRGPVT